MSDLEETYTVLFEIEVPSGSQIDKKPFKLFGDNQNVEVVKKEDAENEY